MSTKTRLRAPSITCLLCDGLVAYTRADRQRFDSHMKVEHGASGNLSYLLAGCLMSKEERNVVSAIIEEREESKVDAVAVEEVEDTENEDMEVGEVEMPKKAKPVPEEILNTDNEIQEIENEILLYGGVGREKESHPCNHCEKTFAKSQSLWLHQKKTHKGRKREQNSVKSQDSGAKKVKLTEETKSESDEEENVAEMITAAADIEVFNSVEEKDEEAENEKKSKKVEEKGKIGKSKKPKARKGENSTRSVEDTLASSEVGEIFETNDEIGNTEDKKMSKESVAKESESETKMMTKESVVRESEYFRIHTQDITNYKKRDDEELKTMDYLPPGWFCIERVLASGRKILTFVNPDLTISFRSKVAVFEFIKFLGVYSGQDLEDLAKNMSIKAK